MKRILSTAMAALCAVSLTAQSYHLGEMSDATFEAGGDQQWNFEWYDHTTHLYNPYAYYGTSSYCNFLDWHNPERLGGQRITEIEGVEVIEGQRDFYWAANLRPAWYNIAYASPEEGNSYERYCYVARDVREGFGWELYGNKGRSSVITFTVPADGYYRVDGIVQREDNNYAYPLVLLPRFRFASAQDQSYADKKNVMTTAIRYGDVGCGEIEGFTGNTLADGGNQRYLAQQPVPFCFAFQGKTGDKVSFEVNCDLLPYDAGGTNNARTGWARTFLPQLDLSVISESEAQDVDLFIDPYGSDGTDTLWALADSISAALDELSPEAGSAIGEWPATAIAQIDEALNNAYLSAENGEVNCMNVDFYLDELRKAWDIFMQQRNTTDWTAEGNYRLIYTTKDGVVVDTETMAKNDGAPWNFQTYTVKDGTYANFNKFDSGNSNHNTCDTWYNNNKWLFIGADATVHPATDKAPAVVFTAPEDAVYHVIAAFHRKDYNEKAPVQLYMRSRFLAAGTERVDTASHIFTCPFGHPYAVYAEQANMDFYVNMHQGDKVTLELDCYTAGRNSSCLSMFDELAVGHCTLAEVPQGAALYNPYAAGDKTPLIALCDSARQQIAQTADKVGDNEGMYSPELLAALQQALAGADAVLADAEAQQGVIEQWMRTVGDALDAYIESRRPFEFKPRGVHGIRLAGTEQHLTRKNSSGSGFFYAQWATEADIMADIEKNATDITQYSWLFNFNEWDYSGIAEENLDESAIGSTVVTAADDVEAYLGNGYFIEGVLENTNTGYNLRFFKQEATDSVFCVRRMDGTYWTDGKMEWSGGTDHIRSSKTPVYAFVIDDTYLPGSTYPTAVEDVKAHEGTVKSVRYFNLQGQRLTDRRKGVMMRQRIMTDGTHVTEKVIVK